MLKRPELRLTVLGIALITAAVLCLCSCDSFYISTCTLSTPVPVLDSVSPKTIDVRTLPVTITATGSDFQTWSQIHWGSIALPTTYVDSQHLSTIVTPNTLASLNDDSGAGVIFVFTEGQGNVSTNCANGGSSANITIIVN